MDYKASKIARDIMEVDNIIQELSKHLNSAFMIYSAGAASFSINCVGGIGYFLIKQPGGWSIMEGRGFEVSQIGGLVIRLPQTEVFYLQSKQFNKIMYLIEDKYNKPISDIFLGTIGYEAE
jgi:hypothetical protein